jgi:hypothetical protein
VVLRKTTASKRLRRLAVKPLAFSVALTEKPFARPRLLIAAIPAGIESWRKPAVLEKTSTWARGFGFASGSSEQAISPAAARPSSAAAAVASVRPAAIRMLGLCRA